MIMQVEHLSKSFGGRTLFSDVTFKLEEYDRLALVGPNGAGKDENSPLDMVRLTICKA